MPYCKEFVELFNSPHSDIFNSELFSTLDLSDLNITPYLKGLDYSKINLWLENLFDKYIQNKNSIRPFHLGLGNPNANILIIGKELGIDPNTPDPPQLNNTDCSVSNYYKKLFVNEAILNYFLWAYKVRGNMIPPNCCIQDPEFASSFCHLYNTETKKRTGHYWRYINKVVSALLNHDLDFNTQTFKDSFFAHVFLTELNNVPSSKSINPQSLTVRDKFNDLTSIPFFKKFKYIVFSCRTYLRDNIQNYDQEIERLYNVKSLNTFVPTCNIKEVYESSNQRVIVCNHISGGAGWSNEELVQLGKLLNKKL